MLRSVVRLDQLAIPFSVAHSTHVGRHNLQMVRRRDWWCCPCWGDRLTLCRFWRRSQHGPSMVPAAKGSQLPGPVGWSCWEFCGSSLSRCVPFLGSAGFPSCWVRVPGHADLFGVRAQVLRLMVPSAKFKGFSCTTAAVAIMLAYFLLGCFAFLVLKSPKAFLGGMQQIQETSLPLLQADLAGKRELKNLIIRSFEFWMQKSLYQIVSSKDSLSEDSVLRHRESLSSCTRPYAKSTGPVSPCPSCCCQCVRSALICGGTWAWSDWDLENVSEQGSGGNQA